MGETSFSKNSFFTLLTEIIIFIFGFIYLIVVARILGPEGKGIYSLILLIPGLMMVFGSFGIESANVYFIGSKKYKIQEVVANSIILSVVLGVFLVVVFWGISQTSFFQQFLRDNKIPPLYLWVIILTVPLYFISSFLRNVLRGYGNIEEYNKVRIVEGLVLFAAGIIFLLLLKQGLWGAVLSSVLSVFAAAFLSIFLVQKLVKIFPLSLLLFNGRKKSKKPIRWNP